MLIKPNKRSNLKKHGIKCFFGGKTNQFEKSATKRRVILLNFLEQKQTKNFIFPQVKNAVKGMELWMVGNKDVFYEDHHFLLYSNRGAK